jgi:hypothetical protein
MPTEAGRPRACSARSCASTGPGQAWRLADGHVANLERLATGPRTGQILALPVEVPGTGRP